MHWYIPIPTSNIRLLCLTYTFSPFIRLIRLFWKKWRRKESKGHDSHMNKCHPSHCTNTQSPPRSMLQDLHTADKQRLITRWFLLLCLILNFLPVPWALHLPLGPTASIKREWEIKSYHAVDSKIEGWVYISQPHGGASLLLREKTFLSYI